MKKGIKTRFKERSRNDVKGTGSIRGIKNKISDLRRGGGSEIEVGWEGKKEQEDEVRWMR